MNATVATGDLPARMPAVARLGFDDGWLILGPHFLNLGLPVLLVDNQLIGRADRLGMEAFGSRNPHQPLHPAKIQAGINGGGVSLWSTWRSQPTLLATHWFQPIPPALHDPQRIGRLILITGDSYAVQLSWSALWTCSIGISQIAQNTPIAHPDLRQELQSV